MYVKGIRSLRILETLLETLSIHIRNDNSIKGIQINDHEFKLIIFADNLTVFFKDSASFHRLVTMLQIFSQYSGLKVNKEKTEVMNLRNSDVSADELKIEGLKKWLKFWAYILLLINLALTSLISTQLLNRSGSFSRIGTGEVSP